MDLNKIPDLANELTTAARQDGLRRLTQRFLAGFEFLRLIEDAARPRIVEKSRGRGGSIKVDTGLPDLGAKRFFEGLCTPMEVGLAGILGAISLLICIRGMADMFISIATEHPPVLAMLVVLAFIVALTLLGAMGVVWSLHTLLIASVKATSELTVIDRAQLTELIQKNSDVVKQVGDMSCNDYKQLAQFIVNLRHEIADLEIQRSI